MLNRIEIQRQMESLDDPSLRRLVILEHADYRPEAVEVAREEMARRGLPTLTPEEYWERHRDEWLDGLGFCYSCWAGTTRVPLDSFVGTRLVGKRDPCPMCRSVIRTKYFCVFSVPLIPLDDYRVIHYRRGHYVARKVKAEVHEAGVDIR